MLDETETVVEVVQALASFHVAEAASGAGALDQEALRRSAFPALGWAREPSAAEDLLVRTLVPSALLEEPHVRSASSFVAMCEFLRRSDEDIDRWLPGAFSTT